jgi:hypothetical protein
MSWEESLLKLAWERNGAITTTTTIMVRQGVIFFACFARAERC